MKTFVTILLLAVTMSFGLDSYSAAMCTKVNSSEYCLVSDSEFKIVHIDGAVVVGNLSAPGNESRYVETGDRRPWINGSGVHVFITPLKDTDDNLPAMLFESNKNVWITDRSGCVILKYWKGPVSDFPKVYSYTGVDTLDQLKGLIDQCAIGKVAKGKLNF